MNFLLIFFADLISDNELQRSKEFSSSKESTLINFNKNYTLEMNFVQIRIFFVKSLGGNRIQIRPDLMETHFCEKLNSLKSTPNLGQVRFFDQRVQTNAELRQKLNFQLNFFYSTFPYNFKLFTYKLTIVQHFRDNFLYFLFTLLL